MSPDNVEVPRPPSIDEATPEDEGGAVARIGFNYQDETAVGVLLEMLGSSNCKKVHCETHDDLVLVHESESEVAIAEFIQVKGGEIDKLWSIADISVGATGTSIYETSIKRDRFQETSTFRIVTLRPVNAQLKPLTYGRGSEGRANATADLQSIEVNRPGFAGDSNL